MSRPHHSIIPLPSTSLYNVMEETLRTCHCTFSGRLLYITMCSTVKIQQFSLLGGCQ